MESIQVVPGRDPTGGAGGTSAGGARDNAAIELIKSAVGWVFADPPPIGERPQFLYSPESRMTFSLGDDGAYHPLGGPDHF